MASYPTNRQPQAIPAKRFIFTLSGAMIFTLLAFAGSAQLAPEGFEQVLIPFDSGEFSGQLGSRWVVDLTIRNGSDRNVNLFPDECSSAGVEFPCARRIDLRPLRTERVDLLPGNPAATPGVLVYVPAEHLADIQFSLRVREVTIASDPVGVEIPIVRSRDYRRGTSTFINVPVDATVRASLRVYEPMFSTRSGYVVRVYSEPDQRLLLERPYETRVSTRSPFPLAVPLTSDFSDSLGRDLLPLMERVTVTIERTLPENAPYWPMISITSNQSQRVTILTPQ